MRILLLLKKMFTKTLRNLQLLKKPMMMMKFNGPLMMKETFLKNFPQKKKIQEFLLKKKIQKLTNMMNQTLITQKHSASTKTKLYIHKKKRILKNLILMMTI